MKVILYLIDFGQDIRCTYRTRDIRASIGTRKGVFKNDRSNGLRFMPAVYLLLFLLTSFNVAFAATAEVITVNDGDTLDVTIQGARTRVKLYGIDAPESGQHGNVSSTRFLRRLVSKRPLEIKEMGTDVFGRTLAIVFVEGKGSSINADVVANGYAWVNAKTCIVDDCRSWEKIESRARMLKLGIWSGFDLVPPWEFKKGQQK